LAGTFCQRSWRLSYEEVEMGTCLLWVYAYDTATNNPGVMVLGIWRIQP
jgi:hypothetical protein